MEHVTKTTYFRYYPLLYTVKIQCTGGKHTRYTRLIYGQNIIPGILFIVLLFNIQKLNTQCSMGNQKLKLLWYDSIFVLLKILFFLFCQLFDTKSHFNSNLCFNDIYHLLGRGYFTWKIAGQGFAMLAEGAAWRFFFVFFLFCFLLFFFRIFLECPVLLYFFLLFLRQFDIDHDTI